MVARTRARTGWTIRRILLQLGVSKARYRAWVQRAAVDALTDRPPVAPYRDGILPEEKSAVLAFALAYPKEGYRRLACQMIDAGVAYSASRLFALRTSAASATHLR